jgi:hypothetical protein
MKNKSLVIYLILLSVLCAGFVIGAKRLGEQGNYLAGLYMFTPAIAALVTRLFFYEPHFKDANLQLGRISDYSKFWLASLSITVLSFVLYTALGAVSWDFSGRLAHIAMNNAARSLSYFVVVQNQLLANLGQVLAMVIVVAVLYATKELGTFGKYLA